ncbi:MAG: matrixin family metalloprotease [Cyclobacteriaceae bacterium]
MNRKILIFIFLFLLSFSCNDEHFTYPTFFECNSTLGCGNGEDFPYCTWGYKFGDSNPYSPSGSEIPGPRIKATSISYKFLEAGVVFKTSLQNYAESLMFNDEVKIIIRGAISEWASVANVNFSEKPSNEATDITIVSAFIPLSSLGGFVGGVGYPALTVDPCKQLAGYLVINSKIQFIKPVALHEMGHVLGLGHVTSKNAMNPNSTFDQLQSGDILGILSIYGAK